MHPLDSSRCNHAFLLFVFLLFFMWRELLNTHFFFHYLPYQEGVVSFPPTYKYQQGTNQYERRVDKKVRFPAWCDRIQHFVGIGGINGPSSSGGGVGGGGGGGGGGSGSGGVDKAIAAAGGVVPEGFSPPPPTATTTPTTSTSTATTTTTTAAAAAAAAAVDSPDVVAYGAAVNVDASTGRFNHNHVTIAL
jgi:hypothetical protein